MFSKLKVFLRFFPFRITLNDITIENQGAKGKFYLAYLINVLDIGASLTLNIELV
jgi:hypothetical protein